MENLSSKTTKKQSRKYLRTLTKDKKNKLRSSRRVVKYGLVGFGRNIWLSIASTLVMTITLLILFTTVFANVILTETAISIRASRHRPYGDGNPQRERQRKTRQHRHQR